MSSADFGLDLDWMPEPLAVDSPHVPSLDPAFRFEPQTPRAILAGFRFNHRVLIQGLHGSGKSSHVEQVAARLGWPLMRVNLDSDTVLSQGTAAAATRASGSAPTPRRRQRRGRAC